MLNKVDNSFVKIESEEICKILNPTIIINYNNVIWRGPPGPAKEGQGGPLKDLYFGKDFNYRFKAQLHTDVIENIVEFNVNQVITGS